MTTYTVLASPVLANAGKPSNADIETAMDWLYMMWDMCAIPDGTDGVSDDIASPVLRVLNLLESTLNARVKSAAVTQAKKDFAEKHGIPYSQVRTTKKESN